MNLVPFRREDLSFSRLEFEEVKPKHGGRGDNRIERAEGQLIPRVISQIYIYLLGGLSPISLLLLFFATQEKFPVPVPERNN